jgi:hypothetical protein
MTKRPPCGREVTLLSRGAARRPLRSIDVRLFAFCCALPSLIAASAAFAQEPPAAPEVVTRLTACREIVDPAQRLACFDREVAAFAQAQAAREVVVVDREQAQRTRRTLFGLALPDVGRLFGGEANEAIEATITHLATDRLGRVTFQLDTGAVWTQTDGRRLTGPRVGSRVRIRRGPLGSFIANVDDRVGIRVVRQR